MASSKTVLFVLGSHDKHLNGKPTGWYLPECWHPYHEVTEAGFKVAFASVKGGEAPLDPDSVEAFKDDEICKKYMNDAGAQKLVKNTTKLSEINSADYVAIFMVGGHAPMHETKEPSIIAKFRDFYQSGKLTAAVCHGPACLVEVKDKDGKPILAGRECTGFSNAEEEQVGMVDQCPFALETRMKELGGKYGKAAEPWGSCVKVDGNLITGQNPQSATDTGKAIVEYLSKA